MISTRNNQGIDLIKEINPYDKFVFIKNNYLECFLASHAPMQRFTFRARPTVGISFELMVLSHPPAFSTFKPSLLATKSDMKRWEGSVSTRAFTFVPATKLSVNIRPFFLEVWLLIAWRIFKDPMRVSSLYLASPPLWEPTVFLAWDNP